MVTIQAGALAGLVKLLLDKGGVRRTDIGAIPTAAAAASFVWIGLGLLCASWVLSAVPSVTQRIHDTTTSPPAEKYDVYELPMYADGKSPRLGNMIALQHWLWALGLGSLGVLVLSYFAG
jgi:hypothetical protein